MFILLITVFGDFQIIDTVEVGKGIDDFRKFKTKKGFRMGKKTKIRNNFRSQKRNNKSNKLPDSKEQKDHVFIIISLGKKEVEKKRKRLSDKLIYWNF